MLTFTHVSRPTRIAMKRALFPGLDLHTRCRYHYLPRWFRPGPIDTLDAGCGNGALAYAAYRLGNRVLGVSIRSDEVQRNREYFGSLLSNCDRLQFRQMNLYELPTIGRKFDQIVCSETLEHITRDAEVVASFADVLRPGGVLHLCCPFALHTSNNLGRVNGPEDGGHVRDGYTLETYQSLLARAGLQIVACGGLGSPLLVNLDRRLSLFRGRHGDAAALPLFLVCLPLTWLDRPNPRMPLSLYVQATKPT
ncbi:MAG: class I SAM-dependent methyltransferase [Chloroflexi bacterium]|nr:class I SAM-dependent methyltransferase [Chloroflexota bacterium]MBV9597852.1 class I SAM-dependent methyltransferase [Chloroflexota bacterium]